MGNSEICTWCDTEIVWDPELGRESTCPHCYNELEEYRSIKIEVDSSEPVTEEGELNLDFSHINEEALNMDELIIGEDEAQDVIHYEQALEHINEHTDKETLECVQCEGPMVYVGNQTMGKGGFESITLTGTQEDLLSKSYSVDVHICPDCFEVRYILSDEDRIEFMSTIKRFGEAK